MKGTSPWLAALGVLMIALVMVTPVAAEILLRVRTAWYPLAITFLPPTLLLLLLQCIQRCRAASPSSATTPPKATVPNWVGATLVDINNVRGALRFEQDVDSICAALYHWATVQPPHMYTVLAVDHGPSCRAFLVGERVVVAFAGKRLEADDSLVVGTYTSTLKGEHVLVVSSDAGLRGRCTRAAKLAKERSSLCSDADLTPQLQPAADCNRRHAGPVHFESRLYFQGFLQPAEPTGVGAIAAQSLFRGPAPLSAKAAAAVRRSRRERSGIKSELTWMRVEQAKVLFDRLQAALTDDHELVRLPLPSHSEPDSASAPACKGRQPRSKAKRSSNGQAVSCTVSRSAWAHAAFLNDVEASTGLHKALKGDNDRFRERQLLGEQAK